MARIKIVYCTKCGWLPRSTWMAQELLNSFSGEVEELALSPGTNGIFQIFVNEDIVWDRKVENGFPEIKKLKQLIRDKIAPGKDLGHTDRE